MTVALCLLTWNEIKGCELDVPRVPIEAFDQVFAVDNGSTDGTVEFLEGRNIRVVRQSVPTYNGAYHCAFEACECDYLVFFHPKGSVDPAECLKFRDFFANGCDLVIAGRMGKGAENEEDRQWIKPRKWFVMGMAAIAAALWRKNGPVVKDVLHGFRGYRKAAFLAMNIARQGSFVDMASVAGAYKLGMKCAEFPVRESARVHGSTHFKALPVGWQILKYLLSEIMRKD